MGVDFERRGEVMDRHLAVLRHLLTGSPVAAEAAPPGLEGIPFSPPVESPLPILVGGHAPSALRRAAGMGDGWHGLWLEPEELPGYLAATRGRSRRQGFRISLRVDFRILDAERADGERPGLVGSPGSIVSKMLRYRAEGVDELVIDFMDRDHGGVPDLAVILDQLRRLHTAVLPMVDP